MLLEQPACSRFVTLRLPISTNRGDTCSLPVWGLTPITASFLGQAQRLNRPSRRGAVMPCISDLHFFSLLIEKIAVLFCEEEGYVLCRDAGYCYPST